jgi:hypothetical protein
MSHAVAVLHEIKRVHEARCFAELRAPSGNTLAESDLIAIGPDIVAFGSLKELDDATWLLELQHFVIGDRQALVDFISTFEQCREDDRYVLLNELGDGRLLRSAPALVRKERGYEVRCEVQAPFARVNAANLGTDIALSLDGDLVLENGDLATVSGLAALEQKIRLQLSLQRGDDRFHPRFGARLVEYYQAFRGSPWLESLLKLDVVRLAAIPYTDSTSAQAFTPLQCVNRVGKIGVDDDDMSHVLTIHVELDVEGVGSRGQTVTIRL